ncbi:NADPH-dependent assimilatory sulfite reductase hemoprotein subunit [Flavisolibacter ginsenosidimutans]|uniref:assimilatory sulfite reductase (NADPH) n=1 Tax=Flavisolibacter ginsenosidimutans TaxID=661481 RepID=A0A5B8UGZ3_9BACT|nr:NADPH-dependent assimilatory sulfite reductase hemoprotein subunit [Flavisolibacter ginsenosidimutans]QEC55894.1 NADPH-dependent assimilatory sulfite reductase hemoprotein subunit [Flavisolibacter ginsenosidimutans]
MTEQKNLSGVEKIKQASMGLRGTLKESLLDELTGAVREHDHALTKFHGMYVQDDRDLREERAAQKLDKLYSFMIRMRIPGGLLTPEQWIGAHHIAGKYSTGVIKITTRQTIQLHGILKHNVKPTLKDFNLVGLDSIAACGDVNRNVIASSHPSISPLHAHIHGYARKISEAMRPKTRAYYEVWLDEEKLVETTEDDPLYQDRYMPRKYKVAIAIPPNNDIDVFSNDVALIAIIENEKLLGFNVAVGGGLGMTHGNAATYPRLATVIGFVPEEKLIETVYTIATVQRDYGNRSDRKLARLKYTVDNMGVEAFKAETEKRLGFSFEPAKSYTFTERRDHFGWEQSSDGNWHYTVFIENGRVTDDKNIKLKTALLKIAKTGKANFRFTTNQNLTLGDIAAEDKATIESILTEFKLIEHTDKASGIRRNAVACVALNTCPLAMAEAQRYLPTLLSKIELLLQKHNLLNEEISIRMTGCPNGCGRSTLAEIGFIGTSVGHYNLHIGGDRLGERLNVKYKDSLDEKAILEQLDELFGRYAANRINGETFGDFVIREKLVTS